MSSHKEKFSKANLNSEPVSTRLLHPLKNVFRDLSFVFRHAYENMRPGFIETCTTVNKCSRRFFARHTGCRGVGIDSRESVGMQSRLNFRRV